jgi:tripartite-type tricarboxylate transporter receptor subunit TctC
MEFLKHLTGIEILHVPYKGAGPSIIDQISGQIDVSFQTATAVVETIREGRMRALATSTLERFEPLPDLPSVAQTVPGFEASTWFGMVAPAGVPRVIIERLNKSVMKVLAQPAVKAHWAKLGVTVSSNSANEFATFIRSEHDKWAKVAKLAGIKPQ